MHLVNLPEISAVFNDIVAEFIQEPNCHELGTGASAQWLQTKVIEAFANAI